MMEPEIPLHCRNQLLRRRPPLSIDGGCEMDRYEVIRIAVTARGECVNQPRAIMGTTTIACASNRVVRRKNTKEKREGVEE